MQVPIGRIIVLLNGELYSLSDTGLSTWDWAYKTLNEMQNISYHETEDPDSGQRSWFDARGHRLYDRDILEMLTNYPDILYKMTLPVALNGSTYIFSLQITPFEK